MTTGSRQAAQPETVRTFTAPGQIEEVPVKAVIELDGITHYIVVLRDGPGLPIYGIRDRGQIIMDVQ